MYQRILKPVFDVTFSFLALVFFLPLFLLIAALILIFNTGPIFYLQNRAGFKGQSFKIIKFRTRHNVANEEIPDLTFIGKILRRTSLDELPQLINVLKGDMSLIGPRPLLIEYLPLYNEDQARRHNVKPGITGWAQVNGRNAINWKRKFELDIFYVNNCSFLLDAKITYLTVGRIISGHGVNTASGELVEKFKGN
ncbi:MAG: sugar transferase [Sporocytophaga sp.]|uniref:sugar transferase n=1 Tax=Sporocytophaga sp. TaxID=2231183 RepID=UPI001B1C365F|nr:sugar transferase [Sporocytophaga sp.]MBO9699650.1 sugar transferase [Sporocytophaga sp.]